jgi:hypothetical protein
MSTSPAPSQENSASQDSTRQLLDELDALMQRMLSLPVSQLDEEGPLVHADSALAEGTSEPDGSTLKGESKAAPPCEEAVQPVVMPVTPAGNPVGVTFDPAAPPPPVRRRPEPPPEHRIAPEPRADGSPKAKPSVRVSPWPAPAGGVGAAVLAPVPRWPAWVLQPLLWINRTFDRWTALLGGPGRWLRSPQGRAVFGWAGAGLLLAAVVWGALKFLH